MNDVNPPIQSVKTLIIASVCSVVLAVVVLVSVVLPAEYGIDPIGVGAKMGLTVLAQPAKSRSPLVVACPTPSQSLPVPENANPAQIPLWKDSVIISVPPGEGLEYKFHVRKGDLLEYSWYTDGTKLYFDFHGEPKGETGGYFKSYREHTDNRSSGSLRAPFDGNHGWYWENRSRQPVTLALSTSGDYEIIGLR